MTFRERGRALFRTGFALFLFLSGSCLHAQSHWEPNVRDRDALTGILLWGGLDIAMLGADRVFDEHLTEAGRLDLLDDHLLFCDRWAVDIRNSDLDLAADCSLAGLFALGGVVVLSDENRRISRVLVLGEAMLMQSTLANLAKVLATRPRPYAYDPATPFSEIRKRDTLRSFYSGHTSAAFCMSTVVYRQYRAENGDNPWLAGAMFGLSSVVGVLRVVSADHFTSDVLIGAAAGTLVGYYLTAPGRVKLTIGQQGGIGLNYSF